MRLPKHLDGALRGERFAEFVETAKVNRRFLRLALRLPKERDPTGPTATIGAIGEISGTALKAANPLQDGHQHGQS